MHIDVTTTISIKDDDGREIHRSIGKGHTRYDNDAEDAQVKRKTAFATSAAMSRAKHGTEAVLGALAS